ncbi:histidinol-phosphate transaminase [Aureisphaera galaxeae]|uniref:histidinol-phosphate transaminase n=1 Tax=Aureisphaera galaxeae TaxID=1538023 RepID=UPI002350708A|nr:histidinol-phosphate transaminase [Aureisphaera galaxeae]MDC8004381.1 histidinol-phosphate transaminase [Aureisphaera galaxeae]
MSQVDNKRTVQQLARPNVLAMKPYSSARDEFKEFDKEMVFLDANENPNNTQVNRYPDPQQRSLKELLASQKGVKTEEILLGNGSDEVLDLIFRVFCEPGKDSVIIVPPTYGMYKVLAETNDIACLEVPLTRDFQLDVSEILAAQTAETKLLFICSPNNPSGNTMQGEAVRELIEKFDGIVVIDEAYIDFTEGSSWTKRINSYDNLIVTQTLSKAYGMAGIRLGSCYAFSEIIALLNKIKPPYNINTLTQIYAYERIVDNERFTEEVQTIISERERLKNALKEVAIVKQVFPSDANFLLIRVDDAQQRYTQLIDIGMVVRNRSTQLHCENTLRITVGTPEENNLIINALKQL